MSNWYYSQKKVMLFISIKIFSCTKEDLVKPEVNYSYFIWKICDFIVLWIYALVNLNHIWEGQYVIIV